MASKKKKATKKKTGGGKAKAKAAAKKLKADPKPLTKLAKGKGPTKAAGKKVDTSKADPETQARIVSTARRLLKTESKLDSARKHFAERKGETRADLKEAVEKGANTEKEKAVKCDVVCQRWQDCEEVEADKKQTLHPLLDDRGKLRESLREQIENINQPSLPGLS